MFCPVGERVRCAAAVAGTRFVGENVVQLDGQLADQCALLGWREKAVTLQCLRIADDEGQIGSAVGVIGLGNLMDVVGQSVRNSQWMGLWQVLS